MPYLAGYQLLDILFQPSLVVVGADNDTELDPVIIVCDRSPADGCKVNRGCALNLAGKPLPWLRIEIRK